MPPTTIDPDKVKPVHDHPEARQDVLERAGLSRSTELLPAECERADAAPEEVKGKRLADWITKGKPLPKGKAPTKELSEEAKPEPSKNGASRPTDEFSELAKDATAYASKKGNKLGSPITRPQAVKVFDMLKAGKPKKLADMGSDSALRTYAQGGARADLPTETAEAIREVCKAADDRRIWPRKVAALVMRIRARK